MGGANFVDKIMALLILYVEYIEQPLIPGSGQVGFGQFWIFVSMW
jgi:hypothetical protein